MTPLLLVYRFMLANILTTIYTDFVHVATELDDINNPPKPSVPVPLILHSSCIAPKYGVHKYVEVNNVLLHYVDSGDTSKPLMLFVHGFPDFWYTWRYQILHFNKNYRVVAFDLRGFGDSDKPKCVEAYKKELLVEDIKCLIEALGYKKANLVCHDWGGVLCSTMLETYPDYVSSLVMLSSVSFNVWNYAIWTSNDLRKKLGYIYLFRTSDVPEMMLKRNNMSAIDQYYYMAGKDTVTSEDIGCYKFWYGQKDAFTYVLNLYRANFAYDYSLAVHEVNVPFTCAIGTEDLALSTSLLDVMNNTYSKVEPVILDNVGHFMQQQDPDVVNEFIETFMKKHDL